MILLLVGFRQTSGDIRTRATATTRPRSGVQTLPTVNFLTNPDLITSSATTTTDPRTTGSFSTPKVNFGSLDTPSTGSESPSKLDGFKADVVEFGTQVSTNSEKNV